MGLIVPLAYYGLLPFGVVTFLMIASAFVGDGPAFLDTWWFKLLWPTLGILLFASGFYTCAHSPPRECTKQFAKTQGSLTIAERRRSVLRLLA